MYTVNFFFLFPMVVDFSHLRISFMSTLTSCLLGPGFESALASPVPRDTFFENWPQCIRFKNVSY